MPWIKGQKLQNGKYVIEKVLGQGGFGITYKAQQVGLNRAVVIKTPNEHLSYDPEYEKYVERFIQEGKILARLSQDPHPHIVGVIDLFVEGNTHCLVMHFVEGENLFEVIKRRGALPESEIVRCICQIGEALTMVHQAGLVHRDAHPGNIMLRKNGKAVLIDFGIAKELLPQTLSSTGNVGNKGFAPYEQMTRGSREPTVDVYCLTATLYYAVTGQPPINSLARKLDNIPLQPPKQIIPRISEQLNQAILKGMALEAQDRPQSMKAWLAMLEAPKAAPPPPVEPVHKKEVVSPKPKIKLEISPRKAITKSPRIIPWGWLIGILFSYLLIGYLLVASNAPFWVWAGAGALALAGALAGVGAVAGALAGVGAVAGALVLVAGALVLVAGAVASAVAVAWAVPIAWAVAVAWAVPIAWVGEKLQTSFSQFHTFLILVTTSLFGLGLGLLVHRVFNGVS
ncbi:serine/threonine protein kinase [Nostoc sp. UHCC 0870]|uniref:serine/threonine protein kinase n=1 Tax=Nostoc sp. UHCC 0870 TaxID=2914041 RepID=UPI001EE02287|nr:serine/threonine-protein kinase [Nostoc sp. UHCC 0870]UKO96389.1 serine/threonine protein kinase [Nostoc sp. UHCC 0870]